MNYRRFLRGNGIWILISALLCVGLVVFMRWNSREEQETIRQLQEEQNGNRDISEDGSEASDDIGEIQNSEETTTDQEQPAETPQPTEEEQPSQGVEGISFRGDSFGDEEKKAEKGFGICMSKLLAEQGIDFTVADYTMHQAGSISQMKLAGVEQEVLDGYVESHKANLSGEQLRITEVKIRDLAPEELERIDQNYIPVICMGYYGGWGSNLDELCEQQQKVLDTYQQKEKYLILGVYPTGYPDREGYTRKMQETWGEHYLAVDGVTKHSISTDEGKQDTVQLVFDKMQELGYLS